MEGRQRPSLQDKEKKYRGGEQTKGKADEGGMSRTDVTLRTIALVLF